MEEAILASASELVTVALKRIDLETETDAILKHYSIHTSIYCPIHLEQKCKRSCFCCSTCQRALETNWLKLEIHPDQNI
jgi:thiazole synthase